MMIALIALGSVLMSAGVMTMWVPENAWRAMVPRDSRWQNQASTSGLLIFAGLGWIGATLLLLYGHALWHGWRSSDWVEVDGTVIESRLVQTSPVRATIFTYRADVVYAYSAQGTEARGTRVDFAGSSTLDRAAVEEELRTRLAPGAKVAVFVDPADVTDSVLERGVPPKAYIFFGLGVALLAIAGWQLRALLRDWEGDGLVPGEPRPRKRGKA